MRRKRMITTRRTNLDTLYETEEQSEIRNVETEEEKIEKKIISVVHYEHHGKPAFIKQKEIIDVRKAQQDIEEAKEEWDMVPSAINVVKEIPRISPPIGCEEVLSYFKEKDMNPFLKYIKPVKQRKRIEELIRWLVGPPKLHPDLISDRNLIFAVAQCPFDSTDFVHVRVLQTLYKALTGSFIDCPRYGSHWEQIGFQGIDPGTDLRGVGFLGLVHLIHFVLSPQTAELAKEIAILAQSDIQNFPFCVMGINITRIVLETVREEVLNKEFNRQKDVFRVTNAFYVGIYLRLHRIWKEQKKTIIDSGYVLKDLSNFAKKNHTQVFRELTSYHEWKAKSNVNLRPQSSFSDIGGVSLHSSATML